MRQQDRLGLILERLNLQGTVGVPELTEQLSVSAATVRRDLQLLESQQLLSRTHGGAVSAGVLYELPMRYRGGQRQDAKRAIAQCAARSLPAGALAVALNGGSTTTEVARALAARTGLRVVTNALNIAADLAVRSNIDLVVCGGSARSQTYELVGPLAEMTLAHLNVDVAFIGVDGLSAAAGLTTHSEHEAHTDRALLHAASRVIVVADSTKLGRRAFARICELRDVSDVVTDGEADPAALAELERAGVRVHVAAVDGTVLGRPERAGSGESFGAERIEQR
ncbi:transcriptional regulator, DeoR family [Nakamurella panacisegetis]|uniref:Transcriptional regulator, DeoR family n=1 Tax=Nakamurella panacisegetis TaxID=1090615 RepID=A0A1H0HD99_9ACTN|nr:DeoR/GlpR family DNA-binding transcription regulator [Nakamurella panacisegetis]SDO17186.1 transcriptional regulator, DeoR family [Nakamurella panacisegetis]